MARNISRKIMDIRGCLRPKTVQHQKAAVTKLCHVERGWVQTGGFITRQLTWVHDKSVSQAPAYPRMLLSFHTPAWFRVTRLSHASQELHHAWLGPTWESTKRRNATRTRGEQSGKSFELSFSNTRLGAFRINFGRLCKTLLPLKHINHQLQWHVKDRYKERAKPDRVVAMVDNSVVFHSPRRPIITFFDGREEDLVMSGPTAV